MQKKMRGSIIFIIFIICVQLIKVCSIQILSLKMNVIIHIKLVTKQLLFSVKNVRSLILIIAFTLCKYVYIIENKIAKI